MMFVLISTLSLLSKEGKGFNIPAKIHRELFLFMMFVLISTLSLLSKFLQPKLNLVNKNLIMDTMDTAENLMNTDLMTNTDPIMEITEVMTPMNTMVTVENPMNTMATVENPMNTDLMTNIIMDTMETIMVIISVLPQW